LPNVCPTLGPPSRVITGFRRDDKMAPDFRRKEERVRVGGGKEWASELGFFNNVWRLGTE